LPPIKESAMNDFFTLHSDRASGVAQIELCRPERMNTMTPAFFPALRDAVQSLVDEARTRVLVIASTGRHFSAGMALDVFADAAAGIDTSSARQRLRFQHMLRRLMTCFQVIDDANFPVICAIQGGCIGGALDLALACDIRVCSADAFFTVQEIQIGMAADLGTLQRLPKIVAPGVARQMAYTGERVGAQHAAEIGLVNAVLPDAVALRNHALTLAGEIAAKSPLALAASKIALNHARDHGTAEALEQMVQMQSALFDIDEMARAIAAWKDKTAPAFDPLAANSQD